MLSNFDTEIVEKLKMVIKIGKKKGPLFAVIEAIRIHNFLLDDRQTWPAGRVLVIG